MIPAASYYTVYLYTILVLTVLTCVKECNYSYARISREKSGALPATILCLILALWIGARPISGYYFGDTSNYAQTFKIMQFGTMLPPQEGEWVWTWIMYACAHVMDVSGFFTLIDLGYFGFMLWGCKRLMPNGTWIAVLFNLVAFSFFTYGTNGIRNGLACSIVICALSFARGKTPDKVIAALLAFVAFNIHHSTSLPILMAIVSMFCIKSFRQVCVFWVLSIVISLLAGHYLTVLFAGLGFDDRFSYLTATQEEGVFAHTGFRWDFLLYSAMPIVLGYYIIFKRGLRNATYELLLNTYTLSNAFWVMVIEANYSNRFAYLSWFLYPIVLAYPLLKMDVWRTNQGKRLVQIMLAHAGFTWFMQTIYY